MRRKQITNLFYSSPFFLVFWFKHPGDAGDILLSPLRPNGTGWRLLSFLLLYSAKAVMVFSPKPRPPWQFSFFGGDSIANCKMILYCRTCITRFFYGLSLLPITLYSMYLNNVAVSFYGTAFFDGISWKFFCICKVVFR